MKKNTLVIKIGSDFIIWFKLHLHPLGFDSRHLQCCCRKCKIPKYDNEPSNLMVVSVTIRTNGELKCAVAVLVLDLLEHRVM